MRNAKVTLNTVVRLTIIVFTLGVDELQSVHLYEDVKIAKCCPEGRELKVTSREQGESKTLYECASMSGFHNESRTVFGYNLEVNDETNNETKIPTCGDVEMFEFDEDGGLISSDGCIDLFNGELYGLKCSDKLQVEVHKLYKCCAEGFSYDISDRKCVDTAQTPDRFIDLIGNSVAVFETKVPVCSANEIFVEYQTDIDPSQLSRSGIKLSSNEFDYLKPNTFCVEETVNVDGNDTSNDSSVIIRSCRPKSLCNTIPCVRRCCANDKMLVRRDGKSICVDYERNMKPMFHDIGSPSENDTFMIADPPVYGFINVQDCNKFKLNNGDPGDAHYISHTDGSLHVHGFAEPFSNKDYCVEFVDSGRVDIHAFVCFEPYPQEKFKYYATGLTISCFFLTLTLICYACLPKLLNLHGKTLVCHVISMLLAYIALAIVQFHTESKMEYCSYMAYMIFFGFLAAFCWQSILAFDIWWTFGSVRTTRGMRKATEMRRFMFYSLYAWSVPIFLTALTVFVDTNEVVPDKWSPQMGSKNMCWFAKDNWRAHFIFFLFPIGLHIFTNAVLFTLTAIHCNKVKNEIQRMQKVSENESQDAKKKFVADKAKYAMNVKLFFVMGVSWTLEILTTLLEQPEELEYFLDFFNIVMGVLVFFIFVCKIKTWHAIQQRLGLVPKKVKGPTTTTTLLSVTSTNGKLGKSSSTSTLSTSNTNLNVVRKVV